MCDICEYVRISQKFCSEMSQQDAKYWLVSLPLKTEQQKLRTKSLNDQEKYLLGNVVF